MATMALSRSLPMSGSFARPCRYVQRASGGTQKMLTATYSSRSSGSAPFSVLSFAYCSSNASEMYFRKISPSTTCLDAAEYKHVVLGLIFLKYISDAFEEQYAKLKTEKGADPEDRDEYVAVNIFWVPPEARWTYLQGRAKDPLIGKLLDSAMVAIERDNASLKGVLPKNYARPDLNKQQLGEVIDLIGTIAFRPSPD